MKREALTYSAGGVDGARPFSVECCPGRGLT